MGDLITQSTGIPVFGTSAAPTTLTGSYVAGNVLNIASSTYVDLGINYTMGAAETGNSIQLKYEVSNDKSTWYRLQTEAASSGTVTRTNREDTFTAASAAATYDRFAVSLEGYGSWSYLRVSVKEFGIASNGGSCWIEGSVLGR